mmetsp:Transcript_29925/g.71227  ORF Transcript_29925/g.71227 Transcript_29925/m.71227 type:complete len:205 (-) Transcript_29925:100-714(-)
MLLRILLIPLLPLVGLPLVGSAVAVDDDLRLRLRPVVRPRATWTGRPWRDRPRQRAVRIRLIHSHRHGLLGDLARGHVAHGCTRVAVGGRGPTRGHVGHGCSRERVVVGVHLGVRWLGVGRSCLRREVPVGGRVPGTSRPVGSRVPGIPRPVRLIEARWRHGPPLLDPRLRAGLLQRGALRGRVRRGDRHERQRADSQQYAPDP